MLKYEWRNWNFWPVYGRYYSRPTWILKTFILRWKLLQKAIFLLSFLQGNVCEGSLNDFQNMGIDLGSIMDTESVVGRSSPSKSIERNDGGGFLDPNNDEGEIIFSLSLRIFLIK